MRLVRALAVIVLAGLVVAVSSWRPGSDASGWQGYVEADFVDVGAEETARLVALAVARGDHVQAGDALFRLDSADATAAREEAVARLGAARADLADLLAGERPEEIAAIEAERDAAAATLEAMRDDYQRKVKLRERNVVAQAVLDEAKERFRVAEAHLAETEHRVAVAKLPPRPDRVEAAQHNVDAAQAAVDRAGARLARLSASAPCTARVEDVFFRAGEQVVAGRPVVRLLPSENLKIRFFVPEHALSGIAVGDRVLVACDGCDTPVPATVSFVADEAEFTPPVIYSVTARQKLVYMVEARPAGPHALKVGQPVDVRLAGRREVLG